MLSIILAAGKGTVECIRYSQVLHKVNGITMD